MATVLPPLSGRKEAWVRTGSTESPGQMEFRGVVRNNNNSKERTQAILEASCVHVKVSCDMSYLVLG